MSISTAALITNYNTWLLTNRCVMELLDWSSKSLSEILIVDDASEQAQPDNLSDKVRVVQNPQNQGYVASINIGFRQLHEDVILIFDSDAYPLMDLCEPISQAFADNPKLGALGFQLVDEHGQSTGSSQPEPSAIGLLLGQKLEALSHILFKQNQAQSLCLYSCGMAVRRIAFEQIGGFDEGFDFLDADIDFSIRLREAGWQIQVNSNLLAFHKGGGSFQTTSKRVLRYHRNRWRLLVNHGYLSQAWLFKLGLATRHALEYSILRILGKQLISEPNILEDKLHSRRQLLREVWSGYGSEC